MLSFQVYPLKSCGLACNAFWLDLLDIDTELALMLTAEPHHGEAEAAALRLVQLDAQYLPPARHCLQRPLEGHRLANWSLAGLAWATWKTVKSKIYRHFAGTETTRF